MAYETDPAILADWLTVEEAARAYRCSERTIRRRLAAGVLEAGHLTVNGSREWRIRPPDQRTPGGATGPEAPAGHQGGPLLALADVERLLAPIISERDTLRAEVETMRAARLADTLELGRLQGRLEEIERLQGRIAALEAALSRLPAAPSAASSSTPAPDAPPTPPPRRRWPWQR